VLEPLRKAIHGQWSNSVWVISRDRGSRVAREATDALRRKLEADASLTEVQRVHARSSTEQHWRSRVQGYPAEDAYLKVYRYQEVLLAQAEGGDATLVSDAR
jgi:hypothetical protein